MRQSSGIFFCKKEAGPPLPSTWRVFSFVRSMPSGLTE